MPPPADCVAAVAGVRLPRMHPHMLRHTFVTTMLDAGLDLRDVQIAARHADPRTTMRYDAPAKTSTATLAPSWPRAWRQTADRLSADWAVAQVTTGLVRQPDRNGVLSGSATTPVASCRSGPILRSYGGYPAAST